VSDQAPDPDKEQEPEKPASSESAAHAKILKRRALFGGIALGVRTVLTQLVVLGGQVILARKLTPKQFGAYAIVQFAFVFLTVFGDAGLGGALIQRHDKPSQRELSTVFWTQLTIGLGALIIISGIAGALPYIYPDLPPEGPWLLRLLAFDFLSTSLRVVPTILMERELKFIRLSALDTINSFCFYLTASIFALAGAGIWSLAIGVVVQSVIGLVLAYALNPWCPSLVFDKPALKPLLHFGVPFQMKNVLGLALSSITPVWGGRALGAQSVGLMNWAQNTAYFPIRLCDIVNRVSFPLYSRFSKDPKEFAQAVERSVRIAGFGTLFFVGLLLGLGRNITLVIYSSQWLPALPLLYLYVAAMGVAFIAPVLAPAFDALGDPKTVMNLSIVYTVGTWLTVPPASLMYKERGFVAVYVFWMIFGNIALIILMRRKVPAVRVLRQVRGPIVGALAIAVLGKLWLSTLALAAPSLVFAILVSAVVFCLAASVVDPAPFRDLIALARPRKQA
jgi:PST family polysaccharide transporter